uniref:Papilin n=1 Tax=Echinococcus granulosus TaxID=6210 RepID=A0A068WVY0_ECHGR|nr:Papilin [Echinococcus granulosus]
MAGTRYEEVGSSKKGGGNNCCLKFWLAFFILATLALTGVVLWLVLAPKHADSSNTQTTDKTRALQTASGKSQPGLCSLPPAQGPCKANIERYYYDTTSGKCKKFVYGGCSGNNNNFITIQQCMETCSLPLVPSKPEYCLLEMDHGPCFALLLRYAYDKKLDQCVEFTFGGCGGNKNNFETLEECEKNCKISIPIPSTSVKFDTLDAICELPQDTGPCKGFYRRWSFDVSTGTCVEFIYGGCKGNANNFQSKEACAAKCGVLSGVKSETVVSPVGGVGENAVCYLPRERGNCEAYQQKWGYDPELGQCVQFIYGGCNGNANNFETKDACERRCLASLSTPLLSTTLDAIDDVCKLPQDAGPCRASQRRWAFDTSKAKCTQFVYGGCRGNANNFESKEALNQPELGASSKSGSIDTLVCHLPQDRGNCYALIRRWAFDANSSQCIPFVYGGCGGNANNFDTREACEQRCLANIPMARPATSSDALDPVCKLPQEVGPCRAMWKRWYYDVAKEQCVEFVYGGCRGNANNFESKEDCEARCGANAMANSFSSVCFLPKSTGPCRGRIKRFFFDSEAGKCAEFIYGGCMGNANNFFTMEECVSTCTNMVYDKRS